MKKQPVVQSAIASENPRDEISEYDVFENLKEIEIENGYIWMIKRFQSILNFDLAFLNYIA